MFPEEALSSPSIHVSKLLSATRLHTPSSRPELRLYSAVNHSSNSSSSAGSSSAGNSPVENLRIIPQNGAVYLAVQEIARYFGLSLSELRHAVIANSRVDQQLCLYSNRGSTPRRLLSFLSEQERLLERYPSSRALRLTELRINYFDSLLGQQRRIRRLLLSWELNSEATRFEACGRITCNRIVHELAVGRVPTFDEIARLANQLGHDIFDEKDCWTEQARELWSEEYLAAHARRGIPSAFAKFWCFASLSGVPLAPSALGEALNLSLDISRRLDAGEILTSHEMATVFVSLQHRMERRHQHHLLTQFTELLEDLSQAWDKIFLHERRIKSVGSQILKAFAQRSLSPEVLMQAACIFRNRSASDQLDLTLADPSKSPDLSVGLLCCLAGDVRGEQQLWKNFIADAERRALRTHRPFCLLAAVQDLWGVSATQIAQSWSKLFPGRHRSGTRIERLADGTEGVSNKELTRIIAVTCWIGLRRAYTIEKRLDHPAVKRLTRARTRSINYWLNFAQGLIHQSNKPIPNTVQEPVQQPNQLAKLGFVMTPPLFQRLTAQPENVGPFTAPRTMPRPTFKVTAKLSLTPAEVTILEGGISPYARGSLAGAVKASREQAGREAISPDKRRSVSAASRTARNSKRSTDDSFRLKS